MKLIKGISIMHALKKFFTKGTGQAIFIALPVTLAYGPFAFLGILMGFDYFSGVRPHLYPEHTSVPDDTYFFLLFTGIFGILGISGAWLRFLFDKRLNESKGILSYIVAVLLLTGVAGVVILLFFLFDSGVSLLHENLVSTVYWIIIPAILAIYGLWLALKILFPAPPWTKR